MANSDKPQGLLPLGSYQAVKYEAGALICPGDMVSLSSDGQVDPVVAGARILGCAVSLAKVAGDEVMVVIDPQQR
jgi:hypothetical protein